MTKDEALKQAFKALEYHTAQTRPVLETINAITAIKEVLAQQETEAHLQAVSEFGQLQAQPERPQNCGTEHCSCIECVMEPEQEPMVLSYLSERNFCPRCGKRLMSALLHTCTPPNARTFDDYGNKLP